MSKPTVDDVIEHLMQHYNDLSVMSKELLGVARQVLVTHDILVELSRQGSLSRLHISRERLRKLITTEDLPVEVGTPFQRIEAEVLQADYGTVGVTIEVVLPEGVPMPDFTKDVTLTIRAETDDE